MAKALTRQAFGAPSPETLSAIDDEAKAAGLRQACLNYEAQRRDIEAQFDTALSTLRERYLAQVLDIHAAA